MSNLLNRRTVGVLAASVAALAVVLLCYVSFRSPQTSRPTDQSVVANQQWPRERTQALMRLNQGNNSGRTQCSKPAVYTDPNRNVAITFVVPEGWSVWACIVERFPSRGELFYKGAVDYLQQSIDKDPSLPVRDVNSIPVGYKFIMGGDGAGPLPG